MRVLHTYVGRYLIFRCVVPTDLLQVMVVTPENDDRPKKLEDVKLLFINMHHLINEYRPHQARETLNATLSKQKEDKLEVIARLDAALDLRVKALEKIRRQVESVIDGVAYADLSLTEDTQKNEPSVNELCQVADDMSERSSVL